MRAENAASIVDGNAAAGILSEIFTGDVTILVGVCGPCGAVAPLGETLVELDEFAAIVRCRGCTHTLLTVLRAETGTRVLIGGLRELSARDAGGGISREGA